MSYKVIGSKFIESKKAEVLFKSSNYDETISKYISQGYTLVNESDNRVIYGRPTEAVIWLLDDETDKKYIVNFHSQIKDAYGKQKLYLATFDRFMKDYYNGNIEFKRNSSGFYFEKKEKPARRNRKKE